MSAPETAVPFAPIVPRPSKRSRSMRGNFNATKRPWAVYWKRRALPAGQRWALRLVEDYVPSLIADRGGPEAVSFAEQRVMETAAVARVCWALALSAGDLDGVAKFLAAERAALQSIGLERRPKPVPSLRELIAARVAGTADGATPGG